MELGTHHDYGTAGVIHALSKQILAEPALLTFQCVGQRLQRAIVGATQDAATPAIIEERIDGFLQHAFFVSHNDIGSMQLDQFFQSIVAIDHSSIEIVQVGGGKTPAIQGDERPKLRWNHRNDIEDHPFRLIARFHECLNNLQAFRKFDLLLLRVLVLHLRAELARQFVDVHTLQEFLDGLGAHHGNELPGVLLLKLPELLFSKEFALFQRRVARIDRDVRFEIKNPFEFAQRHVEQMADPAWQTFEEPHVRARTRQFDMAKAFAPDFGKRDFNTALVADDSAMLHAFVLAAQAFPIRYRAENACTEE